MSIFTRPTVRFEPADTRENPIEAKLMSDGLIRIMTDPDAMHTHSSYFTPAEVREFATELLGLANASEAIHGPGTGPGFASCGHPANEDGECNCSYWPERAQF